MFPHWMRRGAALLPLLLVLVRPASAATSTTPVTIERFVGLPADSADRRSLLQAFRATMDAELPCEKRAGETWSASSPHPNPFRLVDAASPDEAWTLELEIGVPSAAKVVLPKPKGSNVAPRPRLSALRTSRGLVIVVSARPPGPAGETARSEPTRLDVYFASARRMVAPDARLAGGAYDYPWADVGRAVALASLEALHRGSGTLLDDERADLTPATRQEDTP